MRERNNWTPHFCQLTYISCYFNQFRVWIYEFTTYLINRFKIHNLTINNKQFVLTIFGLTIYSVEGVVCFKAVSY